MSSDSILAELAREALVERRRTRRWKITLRLVTLAWLTALALWFAIGRGGSTDGRIVFGAGEKGEGHTALVRIEGLIARDEPASLQPIARALRRALEDKRTRGVVLGIDSPGGSPVQSGLLFDEILRLRARHPDVPVHAVLGDVAASGGYYVAAAAGTVHADRASIVGSIGVRLDGFGAVEAIERLGIERRLLTAGDYKALLDPFSPTEPIAVARLQEMIDNVHSQFVGAVQRGRGARLADDERLFSGLVWSGEEALELGLVDALGSVPSVAREVIGAARVVDFTEPEDLLSRFAPRIGTRVEAALSLALGRLLGSVSDAGGPGRMR